MSNFNNLSTGKSFLRFLLLYSVGFGISFGIVYWIGTKDLGLCFVIATALANSTSAAQQQLARFVEKLVPIFQSLDDNINNLMEEKNRLEIELSEIQDKLSALDSRIDDLENR